MSAPAYLLTPQEKTYFATLYGSIRGTAQGAGAENVVNLFAKSTPALSTTVLGEIWTLADYQESGTLTPQGFEIACRLVGHGQAGTSITSDLIDRSGPLPRFEGVALPALKPQSTGSRVSFSPLPETASIRVSPADRQKFIGMFNAQGPVNGLLGGDKAGTLFMRSNLPNTTLAQIWKLADTKERGELDSTDFVIGMHLIQKVMSGGMQAPLPETLPAGLYESAAGVGSTATPILPPAASLPRPFTGQPPPASPLARQFTGQSVSNVYPNVGSQAWSITQAEKQQSDQWFDGLQLNPQGFLEGQQAVEFFNKSTLDQTVLAKIWDLCDMRKTGNLNKEEFAVATRLINDQLDGKPLPNALPADLIPPSIRGVPVPATPAKSAVERDLFSLLDDDQPPASAVATPTPAPLRSPTRSVASPQLTAARVASPVTIAPRTFSRSPDIMSSDDGRREVLDASSAEVGNVKTQLASTSATLEKTRTERAQVETAVNNSSSNLAALQAQLEAARTAYTTESSLLSSLQTRAANQTAELAELRSKLITAESDLSALRMERAEVEQSVLRDKEEIRSLKSKIVEMDRETERLKTEAEGKQKEAKQQRGLVAITKKQVERSEEKRDAARSELQAAADYSEPAAGSLPSPAASVRSTNPFERMQGAGAVKPVSPQPTGSSRQAPPVPPSRSRTLNTDPATMSTMASAGIGALVAGAASAAALAAESTKNLMGGPKSSEAPADQPLAGAPAGAADEALGASDRFPDIEKTAEAPATGEPIPNGFDDAFTASGPPALPSSSGFDDAFGVPASLAPSAPSATGFDDSFAAAPNTEEATSQQVDDAFNEAALADKPTAALAVSGGDGSLGAPPPRTTETGAAAFDDAFADHAAPIQPPGLTNATELEALDSSDDEAGPEPAEGYGYGHRQDSAPIADTTSGGVVAPQTMPGGFASTSSSNRPASIASSGGDAFEDARQNVIESPRQSQTPVFQSVAAANLSDGFDDFEREFEDLAPATDAPTLKPAPPAAHAAFDDDAFSQEFDRIDDFAPAPTVSSSIPKSGSAAFDAAFAGFDDPAPVSATKANDGGFAAAFDDSFGTTPAYAPPLPTRGTSVVSNGAAKEDDAPDVKQVIEYGFTRKQAIAALEKHGYNAQAAINALLDSN